MPRGSRISSAMDGKVSKGWSLSKHIVTSFSNFAAKARHQSRSTSSQIPRQQLSCRISGNAASPGGRREKKCTGLCRKGRQQKSIYANSVIKGLAALLSQCPGMSRDGNNPPSNVLFFNPVTISPEFCEKYISYQEHFHFGISNDIKQRVPDENY